MPSKQVLVFVGVGLALVGAMIAGALYLNRGAHVVLEGSIQKVRTLGLEERSSIAIADFRFVNPADYPFIVRKVEVFCDLADGKTAEGTVVAEVDARRLFDYYKTLGPKYNDSLVVRDKVAPRQSLDRMIAARFEVPENALQSGRQIRIRVEDVDGAVSEIAGQPR